ncbi:hypothetical protein [Paraclostridium bifermentans]|uniref:hypothetical protein n=1 Tax=Paraclostridium bifermentans TaxID=1490 RepID=UPI0011DDA72A|nr:hypothetical protein [Paraclostridium bifermentans]
MSIRPKTYFEKYYWKVAGYIIIFFIIVAVMRHIEVRKERDHEAEVIKLELEQKEKVRLEAKKEEKQKKEEASKSVKSWIEYKNKNATFDEKNKTLSISSKLMKTFKKGNGIAAADYEIYETTKEFESLFKDDIDSYKFDFSAELVDNYGNKRQDVVYSIILNRNELNKVNWDGIEPSMLINLASHNYKSPALQ